MSRPAVAIVTMVRNEGPMLRLWVRHHARHVGIDNLVVLDDGSTDGSTDGLGCTVHRLPPLPGDRFEQTRMQLVGGIATGLLAVYDYVAFADADEFLVPDPSRHASLVDLVAARPAADVLGVVGLNVVHVPSLEAPLDLDRPVLEQRSFAKFTPLMCKPALKRVNAPWAAASHGIRAPYDVDPELFMLHLKFADRDRLVEVSAARNQQTRLDGRAAKSSWGLGADDVVAVLDAAVADVNPRRIKEFDVRRAKVGRVVERHGDVFRTPKVGQLNALRDQPLVRLPERLAGAL